MRRLLAWIKKARSKSQGNTSTAFPQAVSRSASTEKCKKKNHGLTAMVKGGYLSHPKEPRRDHCVLIRCAMTERCLVKKPPAGKRQHQRAMKDTRLVQGRVPRLASLKNTVMEKLPLAKSNTLIVTINILLTLYVHHCFNPIIPPPSTLGDTHLSASPFDSHGR